MVDVVQLFPDRAGAELGAFKERLPKPERGESVQRNGSQSTADTGRTLHVCGTCVLSEDFHFLIDLSSFSFDATSYFLLKVGNMLLPKTQELL